tara:strand:+ start:313 stop:702 length:390 start_codon:yes stop_codon:yes gene_type:complete
LSTKVFQKEWIVPASAIDERQHVNNLAYLQWCIDIAEEHWKLVASETLQDKYVWYVLRHTIQYKAEAFEGDSLDIKTWVTTAHGVRSERQYRIFRNETLLIEAQTLWCLVDASTKKPIEIPSEIKALFL